MRRRLFSRARGKPRNKYGVGIYSIHSVTSSMYMSCMYIYGSRFRERERERYRVYWVRELVYIMYVFFAGFCSAVVAGLTDCWQARVDAMQVLRGRGFAR